MSQRLIVTDGSREFAGIVREGESWAGAARRTVASVGGEPVPVDLAGEVKRFTLDHDLIVTLRPMTHGDLPLVTRWRQHEHVRRWWAADGDPTPERVAAQYAADIDGTTPTRMWVSEVNGRSVGFVQDYRVGDYPDFALPTPDPEAMGVDYAIGEPGWVGRGLGPRILWAWALRTHGRRQDVATYFAAPDHRNHASVRVLEKVGFVPGMWFDEPGADGSVATVIGCSLSVAQVLA